MYKANGSSIDESIKKSTPDGKNKEISGSHAKDFDELYGIDDDNDEETDDHSCPEAVRRVQTPLGKQIKEPCEIKEAHGNCNVPTSFPDNPRLSRTG